MGRIGMPIITQYYVVDMNMNVEPQQAKGECHPHFFFVLGRKHSRLASFSFTQAAKQVIRNQLGVYLSLQIYSSCLTDGQEQFCQPFQPRHGPRTDSNRHARTTVRHGPTSLTTLSVLYHPALERASSLGARLVVVVKPYTCGGIRASRCVPSSPLSQYASSRTAPPQRPPN